MVFHKITNEEPLSSGLILPTQTVVPFHRLHTSSISVN